MKRLLLITLLLSVLWRAGFGQERPVYVQYLFNPFLINPSLLATENRAEANVLYNRQWNAIKDGPKTLRADLQFPFNNRVALGLGLYEDRTVLLSTSSAMFTFGYKINLAHDHILGFGLSGGVISNRLVLDGLSDDELNDPALYKFSYGKARFNSQFGMHYQSPKMVVGLSFLQMIDYATSNTEQRQTKTFRPLQHMMIHGAYDFSLSPDVILRPFLSYMIHPHERNHFQTSVMFDLKNTFMAGVGYRQHLGPHLLAGYKVRDFQVGFTFTFPTDYPLSALGSSNEIQLKWLFGQERKKSEPQLYEDYNKKLRKIKAQRKKYRGMIE